MRHGPRGSFTTQAAALHVRLLRMWYGHLLRTGRAGHALVFGADRGTCARCATPRSPSPRPPSLGHLRPCARYAHTRAADGGAVRRRLLSVSVPCFVDEASPALTLPDAARVVRGRRGAQHSR